MPTAVRELIELGLLDQLGRVRLRTKELTFFSKHGKPIWSEPRGLEAGLYWPQFSIHRGTLQQICSTPSPNGSARRIFSPVIICATGPRLRTVSAADFIDKATGQPAGSYDGSLLIAADGIHSAIRENSIRKRVRRCGTAASCGVASPAATRFCPAAP